MDEKTITLLIEKLQRPGAVITKYPYSDGSFALFCLPVKIISCKNSENICESLDAIEKYCRQGYFAAGYVSYEAAPAFDRAYKIIPRTKLSQITHTEIPLLWFGIYEDCERFSIPDITEAIAQIKTGCGSIEFYPELNEKEYISTIGKLKKYIYNGDIYQANFTFRAAANPIKYPETFFLCLLISHPVPYPAFINIGKCKILSFSPELFFEKKGDTIISSPMKGTAKREFTTEKDKHVAKKLAEDEKNRAENLMITDMVRNDIGKIASPGTVKVPELFHVDTYFTLHQMISTVEGKIPTPPRSQTNVLLKTIFKALFPPASITGAPKIKSMEIIAQLENSQRGAYTGTIGCIAPQKDIGVQKSQLKQNLRWENNNYDINMCFNVAIRTIIQTEKSSVIGIGSGIVADSNPAHEWKECLLKKSFSNLKYEKFDILETILWTKNEGFIFLSEHLGRAESSQRYFCRKWDKKSVTDSLNALSEKLKNTRWAFYKVRLLINHAGNCKTEFTPLDYRGWAKQELKIKIHPVPVNSKNLFLYHKTTHREIYNSAFREARSAGFDEVIFFNEKKQLTEGAITNVFIRKKNNWYTPTVECGLLAGIWRKKMIAKLNAVETVVPVKEISEANEIIIGNSVRDTARAHICFSEKIY